MPPRKRAYEGRHRTEEPDAPAKAGTKPATPTRRRGVQHQAAEESKAPAKKAAAPKAPAGRGERGERVAEAADRVAFRSALARGEGKPSVTGRAVGGAAAGTAAGAALAGPPGAAAGAVVGGAGGALAGRKAKAAYKAAMRASPGMRRALVAEFLVCFLIAVLSPLTDKNRDEKPTTMLKRLTAIMLLFFILGLVGAAGRGWAKFAAGFGGLATVALAVSQRDLFMKIGNVFSSGDDTAGEISEAGIGGIPRPDAPMTGGSHADAGPR